MARVFRAEDIALGRTVAVKMMRPSADAVASPERTRNEMRVLASVNHPALVTLYDARVVPGGAEYLVMEYIDGPTLAQRLHDGPRSEKRRAGDKWVSRGKSRWSPTH